jgi:arginine decarboxylase
VVVVSSRVNPFVPRYSFFTKGVGNHKEKLRSFELALRDAKIERYNLVYVSSILPPKCKIITRARGLKMLSPGQILYCVMARNESNEPNRLMAASVGVAVPKDPEEYGYLSEHHSFGETEKEAGDYAEDLSAAMLGSTLGIDLDPEIAWDEKKQIYKASGEIIRTRNVTQSALVQKGGIWTTVVAAAVFVI